MLCTTHSVTATPTAADRASSQKPEATDQNFALGPVDEGLHRGHRLGHRQHADNAALVGHRRGHVQHRAAVVALHLTRGAGPVLAAQGAGYVAPLRIVLPLGGVGRVEHHQALRIGHIDAEVQRLLVQPPDARVDGPPGVGRHLGGKQALGHAPGAQVVGGQLGQDVGGVHHHVFHHLAHAGLDLCYENPQYKKTRQPGDQEKAEQDADAQVHPQTKVETE